MINSEKIGLVGASTPLLDTITNVGGIGINKEDRSIKTLAGAIQKSVAAELKMTLEHGVSDTAEGQTPGNSPRYRE